MPMPVKNRVTLNMPSEPTRPLAIEARPKIVRLTSNSGLVGSLGMLSVTRFFTGIGIGAAFPGAAALTGDYAPQRRRALMIVASFTGAPLGGFLRSEERRVGKE